MRHLHLLALFLFIVPTSLLAQSNPVPFLNQPLVPSAVQPGGTGFLLTVNGSGFAPGSLVTVNGSPRFTNVGSPSQLSASIDPSDIAISKTLEIGVENPRPDGWIKSNVAFLPVTTATSSLSLSKLDLASANEPNSLAIGDFNNDGKMDLAVTNFNSGLPGATLSIWLGNGDGTFSPRSDYALLNQPDSIVTGDFDRDGNLDLAIAHMCSATCTDWPFYSSISIFLGTGDGAFTAGMQPFFPGELMALATGDVDGDGNLDLVVRSGEGGPYKTASVLFGTGNGSFLRGSTFVVAHWGYGSALGDFNGDGKLDLALANESSNTVSVLLGNGGGSFGSEIDYPAGWGPVAVTPADFNADGKLDLAVANAGSGSNVSTSISILLGNGDGTFQSAVDYPVGNSPRSIAIGDLNGDGKLDIVDGNFQSDTVSILLSNGDGTFQPAKDFVATKPFAVATADFDNNGRLDVALVNSWGANV